MTFASRDLPRLQGAPVSFLVDFDGTVATSDVSEMLLVQHATDERWRDYDALYDAGRAGSRDLLEWDLTVLPRDPDRLIATAMAQPHDPGFPAFVAAARRRDALVEIVSDGLGFYVRPALERLGLGDLPVATSELDLRTDPPSIAFPYGHPRCFVCGTCKRERVRLHQAAGRIVVFIGDGTSDRFGAAYADLVFAKDRLAEVCREEGWAHQVWTDFEGLARWVEAAFERGELPLDAAAVRPWRASRSIGARPFICGPEIWGEGLHHPPRGDAPTLA